MQVHDGFDVKRINAHAVDDGIRKAMEVELAIVATDFTPVFRVGKNPSHCGLIFLKKIATQAWTAFLIPQGSSF